MKRLVITILMAIPFAVQAQHFEIPDYRTKDDYTAEKENVKQVINWLKENPIDIPERQKANAYLLKWAEGSSDVSIEILPYIMPLADNNNDLLILFIGGWIEKSMDNTEAAKLDLHDAALNTLLDYYEKNDLVKDKDVDKLIKQREKGKLKDWLEKQIPN